MSLLAIALIVLVALTHRGIVQPLPALLAINALRWF